MLVDEHLGDDGALLRTELRLRGEQLELVDSTAIRRLPEGALSAVFARLGGELSESVTVPEDAESLVFADGSRLRRLRFLDRFDVIAKDYLVLSVPGAPDRVGLAVTLTAALRHLASALERNTP